MKLWSVFSILCFILFYYSIIIFLLWYFSYCNILRVILAPNNRWRGTDLCWNFDNENKRAFLRESNIVCGDRRVFTWSKLSSPWNVSRGNRESILFVAIQPLETNICILFWSAHNSSILIGVKYQKLNIKNQLEIIINLIYCPSVSPSFPGRKLIIC